MLWNTQLRRSNIALIGYTNGAGNSFNETQFEYRPDKQLQRQDISMMMLKTYKLLAIIG